MINSVDSREMRLSKEYNSSDSFILETAVVRESMLLCRILRVSYDLLAWECNRHSGEVSANINTNRGE